MNFSYSTFPLHPLPPYIHLINWLILYHKNNGYFSALVDAMGDIVSTAIHNYPDGFAQELTSTSQKDWITKHAELAELSIVETERLWNRFQQLGCDEAGMIHSSHISTEPRYKVCSNNNHLCH